MQDGEIERILRFNLLSPMVLTRHVVRGMMADGGGRIVNVSSIVAFSGFKGLAVYAATKAGTIGFTRALARELGGLGITVNAVAPGFVDTDLTRGMGDNERSQVTRRSALRRLVEPADVAAAVEYLLGEGARNVTGTVLVVDAGATA
jgi:3-oxoacyl-[acyl-carrier protein] reductase